MSDQNKAFDLSNLQYTLQSAAISLINVQRRSVEKRIDWVQFTLPQTMSAFPEARNIIEQQLLGRSTLSLLDFDMALDRIANDSRPKGVLLFLRGLDMPRADLQSLRDSIRRFRARGKRVICFAQDYTLNDYYVASACDEIILQPTGGVETVGFVAQQTFFKDGFDEIGLKFDSIAISPYKGAADIFVRSEPSEEGEAQLNWLLDSAFEQLVNGIAEGRGLTTDEVRNMIDNSPFTDKDALEAGYIDQLMNEEGLQGYLGTEDIVLWSEADNVIPLKVPRFQGHYIAVIPLSGGIVNGESATPPIDVPIPFVANERIGDQTVVRQVRNLMKDDKCAAVVLAINSPGGSATASEAIASALDELSRTRPVVVAMGAVAGSGGYYIATPADYIIAQPSTITGSIGVIYSKPVTDGVARKLKLNPVSYTRGKNATINTSIEGFTDEQREKLRTAIERVYEVFLNRVADARKMKAESVDAIGGGRVWTGAQALENGLVDQLGGLHEALNKARELANVPMDTPFSLVRRPGKPLPAQVAPEQPAAALQYGYETLRLLSNRNLMMIPFELS